MMISLMFNINNRGAYSSILPPWGKKIKQIAKAKKEGKRKKRGKKKGKGREMKGREERRGKGSLRGRKARDKGRKENETE